MEEISTLPKLKKTFVAFLDILGFKDLVKNNDTETLFSIYNKSIVSLNAFLKTEWNSKERPQHVADPIIKTFIVSDSIIIYSEKNDIGSFLKIVAYIHSLISNLIIEGLPVRGALSFGDFIDFSSPGQNILLGKSIVKSYELETRQQWAGCIIDDSCFEHFGFDINHDPIHPYLKEWPFFLKYNVPLKNGNGDSVTGSHFVINWPQWYLEEKGQFNYLTPEFVGDAFAKHGKSISGNGIQQKIKNTVEFCIYSQMNPKLAKQTNETELLNFYQSFPHID